jgi:hypothetical protein
VLTELRTSVDALSKTLRPASPMQKTIEVASAQIGKILALAAWPLITIVVLYYLVTSKEAPARVAV